MACQLCLWDNERKDNIVSNEIGLLLLGVGFSAWNDYLAVVVGRFFL
jgi:hypothetical protein